VKLGDGVGSPIVGDGRVLCLDNRDEKETLVAYALADGTELWHAAIDDVIIDGIGTSPRGSPVYSDGRVYIQSCRGDFHCLNAADGKPLWHTNFVKDFDAIFIGEKGSATGASRHGYTGPPLVDGDRILVGVGGKHGASVVAFDKASGKVLWKSQSETPGYAGLVISQVAGTRQILSFTAEGLMGLDAADGKLLWQTPIKTAFGRHVTMPLASEDTVVVSSHEAGLLAYRITRTDGDMQVRQAWASKELAVNFADMMHVGNYLYGWSPKKKLFCLAFETGKEQWSKSLGLGGAGKFISILLMQDKLFILGDSGKAGLVKISPENLQMLGTTKICGPNWCNPAYVDGKLLARDHESLRCVKLK
jgi:outer membrane protein assembly factor BamB